jgi:tetratricopeptide (TPR) repeat protein
MKDLWQAAVVFGVIVLCIAAPSAAAEPSDEARQIAAKAWDLRQRKDYDKAIAGWTKAIELAPDWAAPYYERGCDYLSKNATDKAIADLTKAISIDPGMSSAYGMRGSAYEQVGDLDRALADYTEAAKLRPDFFLPYFDRGHIYSNKKDFDRAIAEYNKAIELKPDEAMLYAGRGFAYGGKKDYDRGIADYNKAIELKPGEASFYANRGYFYDCKDDCKRAMADYDKAIELDPDSLWARGCRANLHIRLDELDEAILNLADAIRRKDNWEFHADMAWALLKKGDLDRALASSERAVALATKLPDPYFRRSETYTARGEFDKALADVDKALELKGDPTRAHYERSEVFAANGDFEKALAELDAAIKIEPKFAELYNNRGWMTLRSGGDPAKAIPDFDRAIELQSRAANYDSRAWAWLLKGDLAMARQDLEAAMKLNPDHPWLKVISFRVLAAEGKRDKAMLQARDDLKSLPRHSEARPLLEYFLGTISLADLKSKYPQFRINYEVALRGYKP